MHRATDPTARLWLGCNALGHIEHNEARRLIGAALDSGISRFDTADVYAAGMSESELGRLLPADHDAVQVASKFGHPSSARDEVNPCSAAHVRRAVEDSLTRLRREQIDIYLIHFPDPATPIDETLDALAALINEGKIAAYGVSNFPPRQLEALIETASRLGMALPAMVQEEYNFLHRAAAASIWPQLERYQLEFVPFFPLASGLLTGKYAGSNGQYARRARIVRNFDQRFLTPENLRKIVALQQICDRHALSMTALALQWLVKQPQVKGLALGASSADQVRANLAALSDPVSDAVILESEAAVSAIAAGFRRRTGCASIGTGL